jgi:hypothetical protein
MYQGFSAQAKTLEFGISNQWSIGPDSSPPPPDCAASNARDQRNLLRGDIGQIEPGKKLPSIDVDCWRWSRGQRGQERGEARKYAGITHSLLQRRHRLFGCSSGQHVRHCHSTLMDYGFVSRQTPNVVVLQISNILLNAHLCQLHALASRSNSWSITQPLDWLPVHPLKSLYMDLQPSIYLIIRSTLKCFASFCPQTLHIGQSFPAGKFPSGTPQSNQGFLGAYGGMPSCR